MRTLITGATGFLGRHVVQAARARGQIVRALIRPRVDADRLGWPDDVEVHRADLRLAGNGALDAALDNVDVVIHLAAAVTGDDDTRFATTVVGTERLLAAMQASDTRRMVLASSFSVYDWDAVGRSLTEFSPEASRDLYQRDGYTVAKVWQERVVRRIFTAEGWALTVLRPGAIWGDRNFYLPDLGQPLGRWHLVIGPMRRLPLTYVEHCADAFAIAAERPGTAGRTYNLVDDHRISTWQYTGTYLKRSGVGGRRIPVPYALGLVMTHVATTISRMLFGRGGKLPSILVPCRFIARFSSAIYDTAAAKMDLDWRPKHSFSEAMDRALHAADGDAESSPSTASP